MIYQALSPDGPICQGDIFYGIPKVGISLSDLALVEDTPDDEAEVLTGVSWREVLSTGGAQEPKTFTAVLPIKPVMGIVISQNCDAARGEDLSLCEVASLLKTEEKPPKDAKAWQSRITKEARTNPRFFYMPEDAFFGIDERKSVDFRSVIRVARVDLLAMRDQRLCCLNHVATEHFRESLAQFFRRYPVNEWYPLTKEEFDVYAAEVWRDGKGERVEPYEWQK
ncbi:hypothetical protein [Paludisphaera mucosa]|uniref:Inorganic diphosphatase n=1 Tax=Paludisphaera mucosa TaxID=3030827 RepID=A0ABT6FJN8_9BACT|nr:hypothetical protein [Paludisphaera mucosa]MDG3007600.1 hypothetical protein [Paludisphaera mucosa]